MMNNEDWDAIVAELDKYIEENENLAIFIEKLNLAKKNIVEEMDKSFSEVVKDMIKGIGAKPPEIYKLAFIKKNNWSQDIALNLKDPEKTTVVAIGFAIIQANNERKNPLEKTPDEIMGKLLYSAGYILKYCSDFDQVIRYCLKKKIYDIIEVDRLIFLLGNKNIPVLPNNTRRKSMQKLVSVKPVQIPEKPVQIPEKPVQIPEKPVQIPEKSVQIDDALLKELDEFLKENEGKVTKKTI